MIFKLREYLDSLFEDFLSIEDGEKDQVLAEMQGIKDNNIDYVLNDEELTQIEKQIIVENILLRGDIFLIVLENVETIFGIDPLDKTLRCNWWCKIRKAAKCLAVQLMAAATCSQVGAGNILLISMCIAYTAAVFMYCG